MSASRSGPTRVYRDMQLRPSAAPAIAGLTLPVAAAFWGGMSGAFDRRTVPILVLVALAAGVFALVVRSRMFVTLARDTLTYRVYGKRRQVSVAALDYPELTSGLAGTRLIIQADGRKLVSLDARTWGRSSLQDLSRELTARRSGTAR